MNESTLHTGRMNLMPRLAITLRQGLGRIKQMQISHLAIVNVF